ncbi:hypothetical protein RPMA_26100 [Tardiphaga alba]|uniref:Uncharacterized protein n=1 Tax=Tardiphaga alba TaxID=340268 RepID=A0ABX8AHQ2_9BRAD|nr:hypothetical protein [Tardiphaga alba]QUS41920.1 hypothetical protein RPMA_26100 [Tardiphaga alba]
MSEQIGRQRSSGPSRRTLWQIFAMPLVLGILSTVGLISALVGDGAWDALSWLTLGVPILLCAYFLRSAKPR